MKLYDFQQEDVDKLSVMKNVLNASEMGYGKTVVGAALDMVRREQGSSVRGGRKPQPTLIIAPLSGTMNTWRKHYKENYPELKGIVCEPKKRGKFVDALRRADWYDYYIVHWDVLSRELDKLLGVSWNHIIADECHRAKNRKAKSTIALKRLHANYKTGLSGTPVTNRPDELWSVLNWLYPKTYSSYWKFYKAHVEYIDLNQVNPNSPGYHKILGPKNVEQLHREIEPFYVRHLKRSQCCPNHPNGVMPWLPDKTYADPIWVDLTPQQRRTYDLMKKEMLAWVGDNESLPLAAPVAIVQLVRLQQIALAQPDIDEDWKVTLTEPSSKLDALAELIKDNPSEQMVIFTQFSQMAKLIAKRLAKLGMTYGLFIGETSYNDRTRIIQDFQSGRRQFFVGTIKAGGTGLDLFSSSTIVFMDRSWSPAENRQAEDRLWRHGQKNPVTVYDIMARDTVDLGRNQKIGRKWEWIRELLGDVKPGPVGHNEPQALRLNFDSV